MPTLNKVQLIGRLGKDPEEKKTSKDVSYTFFSLAIDQRWKDKQGEIQQDTEWVNVEAWGKFGKNCLKYLKKGKLVYVEGRLSTRKYEKDGATRFFTAVVMQNMQILEKKSKLDNEQVAVEERE